VHHLPVSSTFHFYPQIDSCQVLDPTAEEEKLAKCRISLWVNLFEDICGMVCMGRLGVTKEQLLECNEKAKNLAKEVTMIIREAWKEKDQVRSLLEWGERKEGKHQNSF